MSWDWAIWGALIVGGLAVLGALVLVGLRALQAWREFRRVRGSLLAQIDSLAAAGDRVAEKAAAVGETDELQASLGQLRQSLAQLALLREAIEEVRSPIRIATAFAPRR